MGLGKALLQQEWRVAFCTELALFEHPKGKLWGNWVRQITKGSLALKGLIMVIYASGHCDGDLNVAWCAKPFMMETQWPFPSIPYNCVRPTQEVYIHKSMLFLVPFLPPQIPFSLPSNKLLLFRPNLNVISSHSHPQQTKISHPLPGTYTYYFVALSVIA